MRSTQQEHIVTTGPRFAGRLLDQARPATALIFAAAIVGGGLVSLAVASHVRGAAAPMAQIRGTPAVETLVPASVKRALTTAAPNLARAPSPALPDARVRFGFLEFEDDP
jgi:hypothetical protein